MMPVSRDVLIKLVPVLLKMICGHFNTPLLYQSTDAAEIVE